MSFQAIAAAIKVKTGHPSSKSLLLCLANYADENDECFPSVARITSDTEMSDRTVRTWIAKLEELGFLEIERRFNNGKQISSKYRLRNLHPEELQTANNVVTDCKSRIQNLSLEPITTHSNTRARKNGTRLQEDWKPSSSDKQYAISKGLSEEVIEREAEKFVNYWIGKSGSGATKVDWGRTWRNWCLQAIEYQCRVQQANGGANSGAGGSAHERAFNAMGKAVIERYSKDETF